MQIANSINMLHMHVPNDIINYSFIKRFVAINCVSRCSREKCNLHYIKKLLKWLSSRDDFCRRAKFDCSSMTFHSAQIYVFAESFNLVSREASGSWSEVQGCLRTTRWKSKIKVELRSISANWHKIFAARQHYSNLCLAGNEYARFGAERAFEFILLGFWGAPITVSFSFII